MTATLLDTFWKCYPKLEDISLNKDNKYYFFICDNTTIHRSNLIRNYLKSNGLWMMTIAPYFPELNAVEKLILSFKQKVYREIDNGK